ncbi:Exoribonuclease phosphorolytic domain 2, partial [Trinorchestia longiramus]
AWYNGQIYLDPSIEEEEYIATAAERQALCKGDGEVATATNGCLTVVLMPLYANGQVATMVMSGSMTASQLQDGLDAALETCRKIYAIIKQVFLNRVKKI